MGISINQTDDPRVGSARSGSSGGTLSHLTSSGTDSASLSSLGSTFVPVVIYSAVCLLLFLYLRTRLPRIYSPRCISSFLLPEERSKTLPTGWVNWIKPFFMIREVDLLQYCSLDGFFFLRYLRVLATITLVGCLLVCPILLPVHATGGGGLTQLDRLTIGNIVNPDRLYAHVIVSWIFFGFILFMVGRECIYYVNLRQAYLFSAGYSQRLSARTVMFTCVPRNLLDEARIRKLFGDSVKNVWIPRNTGDLSKLVDERDQTAMRLEKAEIELIKMANAARAKQIKSAYASVAAAAAVADDPKDQPTTEPNIEARASEKGSTPSFTGLDSPTITNNDDKADELDYVHPYGYDPSLPDLRGSVAAQWIPAESRPSHRPLANYGRRVDTIRWARLRLKKLNAQIYKARRNMLSGRAGKPINALFVEFDSQVNAAAAHQIIAHHRPLHMSPAYIGIRPEDVAWSTLRMEWWERILRRFLMMGAIAAGVIFWSIPAAVVGMISNVKFLAKLPFLKWIDDLPAVVLGVIEGLLPALALSLLMAAVPGMLRKCAKVAGVPSAPLIELFTQGAYFIFQVVQVFLITTITSAASSALESILENPIEAKDLLAENLPKASNFYLSYILVQCLAGGAGQYLHLLELIQHQLIGKNFKNPRKIYKLHRKLARRHWGGVFPVFSNLGVIALSYSCIAPLILVFATLGMWFIYMAYKYNLLYSFESDVDTKGVLYPRALMHLIFGIYMAEICLIGLFALQAAYKQLILMVLFCIFTLLVHIVINDAVSPLLYNLPRTLALHDKDLEDDDDTAVPVPKYEAFPPLETRGARTNAGAASEYYDVEEDAGGSADPDMDPEADPDGDDDDDGPRHGAANPRAVEGASGFVSSMRGWVTTKAVARARAELEGPDGRLTRMLTTFNRWVTPSREREPNFVVKWLHPEIFEDYHVLRQIFPSDVPAPDYPPEVLARGYLPPEMWTPSPRLWIPRDEARVSRQEVAHTREVTPISDRGAWLDGKGNIVADMEAAPFKEPRVKL